MGLYDRDYGRTERTAWDRIENPRSFLVVLIIVNVIIFVAQILFTYTVSSDLPEKFQGLELTQQERESLMRGTSQRVSYLSDWFAISGATLLQPWFWFRTLTYGFLHSIANPLHLVFNMFVLYVFGREVERKLGGEEFLKTYLAAILVGGVVAMLVPWLWSLARFGAIIPGVVGATTVGASGAVVAMTVLFACYFPHQKVLFMMVFPMKAWVLASVTVGYDLLGALGLLPMGSTTAFEVHLAGALFGWLYFKRGWNFEWFDFARLTEMPSRIRQRTRRAKLKIHDPDKKMQAEAAEVDRILAKIYDSGEESLTSRERKLLQRYSKRKRQNQDS